MKTFRLLLISPLLLTACAQPVKQDNPTLGSLGDRTIQIDRNSNADIDLSRAIETYEEVLASGSSDGEEADLNARAMHRLGDLELKKIEMRLEETSGPTVKPEDYDAAINWYRKLLVRFPQYEDRQNALYQLARAYEESGQTLRALTVLKIIARDYPNSELALEANFRRGEIFFLNQNFREAELAYAKVITYRQNSKFHQQALFKYGWSLYKQDELLKAQDAFIAILDLKLSKNMQPSELRDMNFLSRPDQELVNDTLRALNLCFSQQEDPRVLDNYLRGKPARIYEFLLYQSLGRHYTEQARYSDAADVYQSFHRRAPWHTYGLLLHADALKIYQDYGFRNELIKAKEDFYDRHTRMQQEWKRSAHNNYFEFLIRSDEASLALIKQELKMHLNDLAKYRHSVARQTQATTDYRVAATWYRRYLQQFPRDPESAEMNFLLAETLYEDQLYLEAATEYERTAYEYTDNSKAAEAGYAALVAYREQLKITSKDNQQSTARAALQSSLSFAKMFPSDPRTPAVLANAAEELYQNKNYNEALRTAQSLVERYPNAESAHKRTALQILANTHFELENYDVSELYYHELKAALSRSEDLYTEVNSRIAACIYKQAEKFRRQGAMRMAINEFKRLIEAVPDADASALARYDIASIHFVLDEMEDALAALNDFRNRYPNHQLTNDAKEKIAVIYVKLERPVEAALAMEGIADIADSPEAQREALWQAAELYKDGNNLEKAASTYIRYGELFPEPLEPAIEAINNAAELYLTLGKTYERRIQIEKIYKLDREHGPQRTNRTRYLAAKSAFELAEPEYLRYAEVRLVEPIRQNMNLKNKYMKSALTAYNKAAEIGVAEFTTAASYRIADMYADFSRKLMDSERPHNLNDEELEQYEIMLEEQAFPFEEKAIELHETNITRLPEVYNKWTLHSIDALAVLMPARYAKKEIYETSIILQ